MRNKVEISKVLQHLESNTHVKIECGDEISDQLIFLLHKEIPSSGMVLRDEYFYEGMSVKAYLSFFAELMDRKKLIQKAIKKMQLEDILGIKVEKLTTSQKKRVAIAREIIKDSKLTIIQEPLKDMDDASSRIILEWLEELPQLHKQCFLTSMSLKQLYLIPGIIIYMDQKETYIVDHEVKDHQETNIEHQLEKISVKFEDKILLFHPNDIDYMESINGKCYLYVRQDAFVCNFTLDELESKLRRFGFYRCHRSYLVNMQKVIEIIKWTRNSYSLKLENREDVKVPLSKGRIEEMKEIYHI